MNCGRPLPGSRGPCIQRTTPGTPPAVEPDEGEESSRAGSQTHPGSRRHRTTVPGGRARAWSRASAAGGRDPRHRVITWPRPLAMALAARHGRSPRPATVTTPPRRHPAARPATVRSGGVVVVGPVGPARQPPTPARSPAAGRRAVLAQHPACTSRRQPVPDGHCGTTGVHQPSWGIQSSASPDPGNHDGCARGAAGTSVLALAAGAGQPQYSFRLGSQPGLALNRTVGGRLHGRGGLAPRRPGHPAPARCTSPTGTTRGVLLRPRGRDQGRRLSGTRSSARRAGPHGQHHVYERLGLQDRLAGPTRPTACASPRWHRARHGPVPTVASQQPDPDRQVLRLTLQPGGYRWRFVHAAGAPFTDHGSGTCH
jgi:hypothetical protein